MIVPQLHLMLIHFPIVGFIASSLLLVYALWRHRQEARTIALVGIVLSGIVVLPVLATGNASEDAVEGLPGVSRTLMRQHSQAADTAGTLAVIAGGLALATLLVQRWRPRLATPALTGVLVMATAATVSIGWTSHLGGEIRRPELALAWNGAGGQAGGESGEGNEGGKGGLLSSLTGSRESGEQGEQPEQGEQGSTSLLGRLTGGESAEAGEAQEVRPAPRSASPGLGTLPQAKRHAGRAAEAGERGERKQRGSRDSDEN